MTIRSYASGVIFAILLAPSFCRAQQMPEVSPLDGYTAGQVQQGAPAGSYALSSFETINPANGQLSINIPLVTVKGRGSVSVPLVASLTVPIWDVAAYAHPYGCGQYTCAGIAWTYAISASGWLGAGGFGAGTMAFRSAGDYCVVGNGGASQWNTALTRGTFQASDGTETEFVDSKTNGAPQAGSSGFNRGTAFIADNGSFAKFTASASVTDSTSCGAGVTSYPSGTLVLRDGTKYTISGGAVTRIEDRNGNLTSFGSTITDSLGREYLITAGSGSDVIQYFGAGGTWHSITVHYAALDAVLASGQSIESYGQLWNLAGGLGNAGTTYDPNGLVSEIDLPDGSKYTLLYTSYGDVAQITLPTGAVIGYSYGANTPSSMTAPGSIYFPSYNQSIPVPSAYMYALSRPLTQRRVSLNGVPDSRTDFPGNGEIDRYDGSNNLLAKETQTIANVGTLPSSGTNYNAAQYNQQTVANYYDAGGTNLLRTVTTAWTQQNCLVNCSTQQTVTTTMSGLVKKSTYAYDQYNNQSDEYDYDWGSGTAGALLRHTFQAYQGAAQYVNENLLNLFFYAQVYDPSSKQIANWDQEYDETGLANEPNMGQYDASYNSVTARGNPTTKRVWLSTTNNFLSSHYTYDNAGNVLSASDANGHTTSFSYTDNYYVNPPNPPSYGFPTTITNAANQQTTIQYDYGPGKPTLIIDPNGARTSYTYASDPLDRVMEAVLPNGGTTNYVYPSSTEMDAYQDQNTAGDRGLRTQTLYDGLGRTSESRSYESSSGYISTTQTYDGLGRVLTTTNPSRYANGSGDGLNYATTYTYDGLGRTTKVKTADGSATTTSYSGNQTTVTDPAGHARTSTLDGVGNLSNVWEDPSGLNYPTTYTYDVLGDLVKVNQDGMIRTFTYDSLGRQMSAANPESGTVSYTYDNVGNLLTRKDNRSVTTTYSYDALNRLTNVIYPAGTPNVTYGYDLASVPNAKGRLTSIANGNSATSYSNYDPMGNIWASSQTTLGQTYSFAYAYNLAGSMTSETYPSGRAVKTAYDGANRASTVTGNLSGQQTNYASGVTYAPQGAPGYYIYANQVARTYQYNARMQPGCLWDALYNSPSYYLLTECPNWGTSNNNGTLQSATVQAGGPGPLSSLATFSASFAYDKVNRLTSVSDSGYTRTFQYDPFGNMWVAGTGIPLAGNTPTTDSYNSNNQLTTAGTTYDLSGNQTVVNGDAMTYDAENRQISATDSVTHAVENYLYDGVGQRVEKTGPGGTSVFVYDAWGQLTAEYSSSPVISPCSTCYLSYDHLGTVRLVTDQTGKVIARHDYLPFGEEIAANTAGRNSQWGPGNDAIAQKFTGQIRDSETGVDFFNARYFGAALGRFTSPDPGNAGAKLMDPQTWNAYAYVRGNPLAITDPTGKHIVDCVWDGCSGSHNGGGGGGGGGSILDQSEQQNENQYAASVQQTFAAATVADQANQAVANGDLAKAAQIAATNSNVQLTYMPPKTADPTYNAFAVAAAMLNIDPNTNVAVIAQQVGVSTSVQLMQQNGSPYQLNNLITNLSATGTADPLTAWHNGSPSWYVGDATNVTHVVDILARSNDPGDPFQVGLQFHVDSYNPTASVVTFFQHVSSEVIPGRGITGPVMPNVTCSVAWGCH